MELNIDNKTIWENCSCLKNKYGLINGYCPKCFRPIVKDYNEMENFLKDYLERVSNNGHNISFLSDSFINDSKQVKIDSSTFYECDNKHITNIQNKGGICPICGKESEVKKVIKRLLNIERINPEKSS